MNGPAWFEAARRELGVHEEPENRGPAIRRYIKLAQCGAEGEPWCSEFANAMLESVGIPGTRNAMARSFEHHANFRKLERPAFGCVVTYFRGAPGAGLGHVGFYCGESGDFVSTLGGNEGDMVKVENLRARGGRSFGLSGYYWPKFDSRGLAVPPPSKEQLGPMPPQLGGAGGSGKVTLLSTDQENNAGGDDAPEDPELEGEDSPFAGAGELVGKISTVGKLIKSKIAWAGTLLGGISLSSVASLLSDWRVVAVIGAVIVALVALILFERARKP